MKINSTVLNLQVPDQVVIDRIAGRRVCRACGTGYHAIFKAPAQPGVCDACGGEVIQRDDDQEDVVRNRLEVYHAQTAPVLEWLRAHGRVYDIDANASIDEVGDRLRDILGALG